MGLEDFWSGNGNAGDGIEGLEEEFHERLTAMFGAMPDDVRAGVGIRSGYRSNEEQQYLYDLYLSGQGNLAAPPGRSNHNHGRAMDIEFRTDVARKWFHANGARYGLAFPIPSEAWHIEPAGLRDGSYRPDFETPPIAGDPEAYADGSDYEPPDNYDMKTQLARVADLMASGGAAARNRTKVTNSAALAERRVTQGEGQFNE